MATFTVTFPQASGTVTLRGNTVTGSGSVVLATAPTLSNPVVGTQSPADNSTKAASTAYVDTADALLAPLAGADFTGAVTTTAKFLATEGIGVGNFAAGTTLGTVVGGFEVFDDAGVSVGFVPVYDAIT